MECQIHFDFNPYFAHNVESTKNISSFLKKTMHIYARRNLEQKTGMIVRTTYIMFLTQKVRMQPKQGRKGTIQAKK